jgi:hypothetical protein
MTSAADFHILSARNVFGLVAVVVAVLIPVGLKRVFKQDLGDLDNAEAVLAAQHTEDVEIVVPAVHTYGAVGGDVEGTMGRRYVAVDSGMDLAGPSEGAEDLHAAPVRGKGKGKVVEIFPNITEEAEEDSGAGRTVAVEKVRAEVKGYGATDVYRPRVAL